MSKIKKFLDFITGYTSFSNKLNRMVNRRREDNFATEAPISDVSMTPEQILELYSMIKDYVYPIGDIEGVTITWQVPRVERGVVIMSELSHRAFQHTIYGLTSFKVYAKLLITNNVEWQGLQLEIDSAKSQLASEDFILGLENLRTVSIGKSVHLAIKHKSYKEPVQKRMRRAA